MSQNPDLLYKALGTLTGPYTVQPAKINKISHYNSLSSHGIPICDGIGVSESWCHH